MSAPEQTPAARPDPSCERHGCKHPLSDHAVVDEDDLTVRPCRSCGCRSFSGWSGQRGRSQAGG